MGKKKEICKWDKKRIKKEFALLAEIVSNPDYICKDCGRAASDKKYLCESKKLDKYVDQQATTSTPETEGAD